MTGRRDIFLFSTAFFLVLFLNVLTWFSARHVTGRWEGVPPVPGRAGITAFFLGDTQFAYRAAGIMLQNLGETGGRSEGLDKYDYNALRGWFFLADSLDPDSRFIPVLAAYYYGAVRDPEKLRPLLDYLYVAGSRPGEQRWRWLGQGVYIARFQMNDLDLALKFANRLASMNDPDMPAWTRQMPAFILNARGDKKEALAVMMEILESGIGKIRPGELNFTRDYICTRILDPAEAATRPLCQDTP